MAPDSPETRLRELERATARLETNVLNIAEDVRAFAPLVREFHDLRAAMTHLTENLNGVARQCESIHKETEAAQRELRERFEQETRERRDGQEQRAKESRTNRTLILIAAIGFCGTCASSVIGLMAVFFQ